MKNSIHKSDSDISTSCLKQLPIFISIKNLKPLFIINIHTLTFVTVPIRLKLLIYIKYQDKQKKLFTKTKAFRKGD